MAAYADNWTGKYTIHYRTLGRNHRMSFRYDATISSPTPTFITQCEDFINAMTAHRFTDWTVIAAEYKPAGALFSLPAAAPTSISAGTATISTTADNSAYIRWEATTTDGNPYSVTMFGVNYTPLSESGTYQADYRVTVAEDAAVANAVIALQSIGDLVGRDNYSVIWKLYGNIGWNRHMQNSNRS